MGDQDQFSALLNEKTFAYFVEEMSEGVFFQGQDGCFIFVNNRFCEMLGYSKEELLGTKVEELVVEEDRNHCIENVNRKERRNYKGRRFFEVRLKKKDHTHIHAKISPLFVPDSDKENIKGTFALVSEVSILRHAEKIVDHSRNFLAEEMDKKTEKLNAVQQKLVHSEKVSSFGKMTSSIAHEFSNPLSGIFSILESLRENEKDPENLSLIDVAIKECKRLTQMLRNMRDFYKPSVEDKSRLDVHGLLDEVLLLMKKNLMKRGIKLRLEYSSNMPSFYGVSDQIKQVFLNLIQNADESIHEAQGEICIKTEHDDTYVKVIFEDNGAGISKENLKDLFEPYFTTKAEIQGSGLGLSVSHGIITKHGGDIIVDSEEGKGASFTVRLPIENQIPNQLFDS